MGKKVAVSIGIKRTGRLPELPGAVNGAKKFGDWAEGQGYETHLVTDKTGDVTVKTLKTLIKSIVDEGETERLIVYFAGHGIQPMANAPYWLLSRWEDDSDEAVNVNLSEQNAKRSGISQIAIFADACRSTARGAETVGGSSIFPKSPAALGAKGTQWDKYFASRLGDSAQEVSAKGALKAFGIFTRCVMRALYGTEAKAIANRPPRVVISDRLADYLEDAVPFESGKTPGANVQFPEVISGWRSPNDVYIEAGPLLKGMTPPRKVAVHTITRDKKFAQATNFGAGTRPEKNNCMMSGKELLEVIESADAQEEVAKARRLEDEAVKDRAAKYNSEYRAHAVSFPPSDSQTEAVLSNGLILVGCEPVSIAVQRGKQADLIREGSTARVLSHGSEPLSILIELKEGNWIGSYTLPGFVGTFIVESELVASVNYAPGTGSLDQGTYAKTVTMLSHWTALWRQGRVGDYDELGEFDKINPSLGIIAAYAYERVGDLAAIDDIVDASRASSSQAVPFDVALLSTKPMHRTERGLTVATEAGDRPVAGSFPLMTQGWSFLDREDDFVPPALFELRKGLCPALWTTFRKTEGKKAAELLNQGEI